MSLLAYYKVPTVWKSGEVASINTTTTIWTPATGKRAVLANAAISVYGPNSTTAAIYFGADSQSYTPVRVALVTLSASASVALEFPGLDNGILDQPVRVVTTAAPVSVTLYGFELP